MPSLVLALLLFVTNRPSQNAVPDLSARAREVLTSLSAREFTTIEARFTDEMKKALPPGRLETIWSALLGQVGPQKSCAPNSRVVSIADKQMVVTACTFERATIDVQFAFDSQGRISGMVFRPAASAAPYSPPSYVKPDAYHEGEVTFGASEWRLPGTLTLPSGSERHPAVVLVHGSGPNDRDESVGANKPFKDLALGLASRGVAVLRYDKRSKVHAARMAALPSMTVKDEVVDDAGEAIKMLRTHPQIDPARIFVLGHSLGGTLVPRIAAANPSIAGAIVLAGATRSVAEMVTEQTRYLAMLDGTISPEEQTQIDAAAARIQAAAPSSYWADLRGYDPPAAAAAQKLRMLVLQGERDYQVTMTDFESWKKALGARQDVTFRSYPALNHLFIAGAGPSSPQEYQTAGHVAEQVIGDIADWIRGGRR